MKNIKIKKKSITFLCKKIILLYIIKVGLKRRGCATWLHQIAEILLNF